MTQIPQDAINAAVKAIDCVLDSEYDPSQPGAMARAALEAAAPHIAAAERERIFSQLGQHQHITEAVAADRERIRTAAEDASHVTETGVTYVGLDTLNSIIDDPAEPGEHDTTHTNEPTEHEL